MGMAVWGDCGKASAVEKLKEKFACVSQRVAFKTVLPIEFCYQT